MITQPATIAAFALLEELGHRPDSQEAFYKLCITLRAASRRFRVTRGVMLLLKKTASDHDITLPQGCDKLLAEFDEERMDLDGESEASTAIVDVIGLEYLLQKWDDLELDE